MYSPGAANVTLTVALPLTVPAGFSPPSRSSFGFALSNFTSPGPRNFDHVIASGGAGWNSGGIAGASPRPAPAPRPAPPRPRRPRPACSGTLILGPSSDAHTVIANGAPTAAEYFSAISFGGPVTASPFSLNFSFGGVFLFAGSSNGSTM